MVVSLQGSLIRSCVLAFYAVTLVLFSACNCLAFRPPLLRPLVLRAGRGTALSMGFMDAVNKAFANDPNLGPASNPGLSKVAEPVLVEFLPSKKQIKAYPGQKLSMIAQTAGETIKYSCKKGECRTCEVNFNGKIVKACQASLPSVGVAKKYTIGIPQK